MQPKRMIEAGGHEFLFEQRAPVRHQSGIEQPHVGGVGQHALVDRPIVRQPAGGAHPKVKPAVGIFLAEIAFELHRPQFDRPLALVIAPHRIGHGRENCLANFRFARQTFRRRHIRHFRLMLEAGLVSTKRHQHGKDRMAVLARGDAPCGEALAVTDAIDVVDDRNLAIARQQEIGVHGMRRSCLHRAHCGDQRLADHLAAEHALPAVDLVMLSWAWVWVVMESALSSSAGTAGLGPPGPRRPPI